MTARSKGQFPAARDILPTPRGFLHDTLQTTNNPATSNRTNYGGNITLDNGTNSVTFLPVAGNLFFRLE